MVTALIIATAATALAQNASQGFGNITNSSREMIEMTIGSDGVHCGSRDIQDYGTSTPVVMVGAGDLVPKGIYSPSNKNFVHGVNLIFQLPSQSDMKIKLGGRLNYADLDNRTDDIKIYMNDEFVGDWNPYDGAESSQERGFIYEIPAKYTRSGLNKLLLTMEHLPADASLYYGFSTIAIENDMGRADIGMEEPGLGSILASTYGTTLPEYTIGDPISEFPERILSAGYKDQVHGAKIKFDLESPSNVLIRMNCWSWKDDNARNDDIEVLMNNESVGFWNPYSGSQEYGNKTFIYEVPSKYTRAGENELALSMEHLKDLTLTWYAIYYLQLEAEAQKTEQS